jgi:large subunit ribosomal protein L22
MADSKKKKDAPPAKAKAAKTDKKDAAPKAEAKGKKGKAAPRERFEGPSVRAIAKYVRTAPRKLRLVADMIRGKKAKEASTLLEFTNRRAAATLNKVLASAMANAENNHELDPERLEVVTTFIDEGPMLKRWIPRSRGRASAVLKRSSHITVVVRQRQEGI